LLHEKYGTVVHKILHIWKKVTKEGLKPLIGYERASGNQLFCCDDATLAGLATNDQRRQASAE